MAMRSFHRGTSLLPESYLPRSGLTGSLCVREDRDRSQNRRESMRSYRQSRIDEVFVPKTLNGSALPIRAQFGGGTVAETLSREANSPASDLTVLHQSEKSALDPCALAD